MTETRTMRRAVRSARAILHGPQILELVQQPKVRRALISAAESGVPPVSAISGSLIGVISAKDAKLTVIKQFVGLCVRAVLEQEGFDVAQTGVRLSGDPIFRTGATYTRAPHSPNDKARLLVRILETLTDDEASEAVALLRRRARRRI